MGGGEGGRVVLVGFWGGGGGWWWWWWGKCLGGGGVVVWCLDVMLEGGDGGALPSPLHTNHHKMLISRFKAHMDTASAASRRQMRSGDLKRLAFRSFEKRFNLQEAAVLHERI